MGFEKPKKVRDAIAQGDAGSEMRSAMGRKGAEVANQNKRKIREEEKAWQHIKEEKLKADAGFDPANVRRDELLEDA